MNEVVKILKDLIARRFYGKVTISFENGRMVVLKKEESIKINQK